MGLDSLTFAVANGVGPGLAELAYARGEPGAVSTSNTARLNSWR